MSEQRTGGIALPGQPSNTPGLPSSFQPLFFHTFNGLNTRPGRIACPDQQMYWCDGWMPIAPDDIRILPDVGPSIFFANRWNVGLFEPANAQDTIAVGSSPVIVGFARNANFNSGGMLGGSVTVTTTVTNEIIVLGIHCVTDTRPAVSLASMTDTAALGGWGQRAIRVINYPIGGSSNSQSAFLWYGKAASPVTTTINFTFSDYVYGYAVDLMHVRGADFASPWDTFGTVITIGGPPPVQPILTAQSNLLKGLMFTFLSGAQALGDETITGGPGPISGGYPNFYPPAGFSWGDNVQNAPPFFPFNQAGSAVSLTYMPSLPVIPSQSVQWRYPVGGQGWIYMIDTLTGS